jgi:hypothetical protein
MKSKKTSAGRVTGSLVKELADRHKAKLKGTLPAATVTSKPLKQPDLYQDPGSGYNRNFTFPQD